jgi:hypothetical protein
MAPEVTVRFEADITNDSGDEAVIILDGYVKGTESKFPLINPIDIAPETTAFGGKCLSAGHTSSWRGRRRFHWQDYSPRST